MFDQKGSYSQQILENQTENLNNTIFSIQDSITSLGHRLSVIENSLNSKIQRKQCLEILDKKVNVIQIKKLTEEITNKFAQGKKKQQEKIFNFKNQQEQSIKKLMKKLKISKAQGKHKSKQILNIKPQQLYLQSNQTMFGMIIDQIDKLKELYLEQQQKLQRKHKSTINLNNEVCSKIQKLQKEIELGLKIKISDSIYNPKLQNTWTINEKKTKKLIKSQQTNESFDNLRINMVGKTIQNLQKQLAQKLNIKDLIPIIKKNISPFTEEIKQMKSYLQESMESTKKILVHQSKINQQLCAASKYGYWQSFQQRKGLAIWQKQITNLFPEGFIFDQDQDSITLNQSGVFLINIYSIEQQVQSIIINEEEKQFYQQLLIRLEKGTKIKVPSCGNEIILYVYKV